MEPRKVRLNNISEPIGVLDESTDRGRSALRNRPLYEYNKESDRSQATHCCLGVRFVTIRRPQRDSASSNTLLMDHLSLCNVIPVGQGRLIGCHGFLIVFFFNEIANKRYPACFGLKGRRAYLYSLDACNSGTICKCLQANHWASVGANLL